MELIPKALILDVETTFQKIEDDRTTPSPYHPLNRLVSIGVRRVDNTDREYLFFYHSEGVEGVDESKRRIQELLDDCPLLICHHAKFDYQWIIECGFKYDGPIYDTMLVEYVLDRGQKGERSLAAIAEERGLTLKKSDLIQEYMDKKISFEYIPKATIEEYGLGDVDTTTELYAAQIEDLQKEKNKGLIPTIQMMFEFCKVLAGFEKAGICVDVVKLQEIEDYLNEQIAAIEKQMQEIVHTVMGDYPYNLNSPEDMSEIIYSRAVTDKYEWAKVFNIGTTERNGVKKKNQPARMSDNAFVQQVKRLTRIVKKQTGTACKECSGSGRIFRTKKDGSAYKRPNHCPTCGGCGILYTERDKEIAGFRITPDGPHLAAGGGFSTSKAVLERIYATTQNTTAKAFIELAIRHGGFSSYRDSVVAGIKRGTYELNRAATREFCRTSFMQHITATGRLSSTNPNFQNLPRAGSDDTFPIRRVIVSRFSGVERNSARKILEDPNNTEQILDYIKYNIGGLRLHYKVKIPEKYATIADTQGLILEADYKALEYRCAVDMARDVTGMNDIKNNVDAHAFTRDTLRANGAPIKEGKEGRQQSKPHTFKPLYGGTSGTSAEQAYYRAFLDKHVQIAEWQKRLQTEAITNKVIKIPSGREYAFPNARRLQNGNSTFKTQIVNYPVQGFATGDIVPCAVIEVDKVFKKYELNSVLFLTVHDSLVVDVYPGELETVALLMHVVMSNINHVLMRRYGYETVVPFDVELKCGLNWGQTSDIEIEEIKHV